MKPPFGKLPKWKRDWIKKKSDGYVSKKKKKEQNNYPLPFFP